MLCFRSFAAMVLVALSLLLSAAFASELRDSTFGANAGSSALEWTYGPWGSCNINVGRVCGSSAGTQVRSIGCKAHPLDGSDAYSVSVTACEEGLGLASREPDTRACATASPQACHWSTSSWSACSAGTPACGTTTSGTQTRTSQCVATTPGYPNQVRADAQCVSAVGAKPSLSRSCSRTGDACPIPPSPPITGRVYPPSPHETSPPTANCFVHLSAGIMSGVPGHLEHIGHSSDYTWRNTVTVVGVEDYKSRVLGPGSYPRLSTGDHQKNIAFPGALNVTRSTVTIPSLGIHNRSVTNAASHINLSSPHASNIPLMPLAAHQNNREISGMAIGSRTRVYFYDDANFQNPRHRGNAFLGATTPYWQGPLVITVNQGSMYGDTYARGGWSGSIRGQFSPASTRLYSSSWGDAPPTFHSNRPDMVKTGSLVVECF